jgi:hypothetical protein
MFLLVLAEAEPSWIISILYQITALIIYYQPVRFNSLSQTNLDRVIVNAAVFLSGMRMSLIAKDLLIVFLLGIAMMGVAVYRLYESSYAVAQNLVYAYIGVFLLFFHAFCLKSAVVLTMALVLMFVTLTFSITKTRLTLLAGVLVISYLYFGSDFEILFESFEEELYKVGVF